jgi:hypothetical protein
MKNPKAISIKVDAPQKFHDSVCQCASELMRVTANLSESNVKTAKELRNLVEPAYVHISQLLIAYYTSEDKAKNKVRVKGFDHTKLFGLQVDMNPTLGTYTVKVAVKIADGLAQRYNIHVVPKDRCTTFTRYVTAGKGNIDEANNYLLV